ncbi:MAG TPA: ImcF-related family protein [Terriglobia bacterium]|nr:ImcF-related family protein [Terriglobia bacterium]
MKQIAWAIAVFILFLVVGAITAVLLHLKGANFAILLGAFAALGLIGAGALLWWLRSRQAAEAAKDADGAGAQGGAQGDQEIDLLIRQAESRLRSSRLGRKAALGKMPVILIAGESGAGKTQAMQGSGFDPELLAGQVSQDDKVSPTRTVNLWFARDVVFVEAAGGLLAAPPAWAKLVRRIAPGGLPSILSRKGPAPRGAMVCVSCEGLLDPRAAQANASSLRQLRERLGECSRRLGISLPVYVLFTKLDRVAFFGDYAENLNDDETTQVLGATLSIPQGLSTGTYAEQQTKVLAAAFDELFYSLSDERPELLARERHPERLPGVYEFPREFRKLKAAAVQLLVDLCRPSQLTASPFLRGFYFAGMRSVVVEEAAPSLAEMQVPQAPDTDFGATRVFNVSQLRQPQASGALDSSGATKFFDPRKLGLGEGRGAVAAPRTRSVQQPVFLNRLFGDVLLKDRAGLASSGASTRTNFWRRSLLAAAAVVCLIFSIGFIVSYLGNQGLESQVADAVKVSAASQPNLPTPDSLQQLDHLRQPLEKLSDYNRNGAPLSLGWGLYTGHKLYPVACMAYSRKFRQALLDPVQTSLVASLRSLPSSPTGDYGTAYDELRAYLITTTNPEQSRRDFLSPELLKTWSAGRPLTAQESQVASQQFDFYSDELQHSAQLGAASCFASKADPDAIAHARAYLNLFPPEERVYRAMLADASKNSSPVIFSSAYPNAAGIVTDTDEVPGAYTKTGWAFMQKALDSPQPYMKGEPWVLGTEVSSAPDVITLQQHLRQRYQSEFVNTWRKFLASAHVVPYSSLRDASHKLEALTGNRSPLLELFWLVSHHVSADPEVAKIFQPVSKVVPPSDQAQYVSSANQNYLGALLNLKISLDQLAQQPPAGLNPGAPNPVTASAAQATNVTEQIAQGFTPDATGHVDDLTKRLLLAPITNARSVLPKPGEALNGQGRALCGQLGLLLHKYPFDSNPHSPAASVAELNAIFQPNEGALSKFYTQNLVSVLTFTGSQYAPNPGAPIKLNPAFLRFFNRAMELQRALYSNGSPQPQLRFSLAPLPTAGVKTFSLTIDGQTLNYPGSAVQFTWSPATAREVRQTVGEGGVSYPGTWGIFSLFRDAQWKPSGSGYDLTWVQKNGERILYLPNTQPMTVGVHLDMMGAPPIFQPRYFVSSLGCVSRVAE